MSIPNFQSILLPFLNFASDEKQHSLQECMEHLAHHFNLTENEQKELLPSGKQTIFANRVGWSRTHLKKAGLLEYPREHLTYAISINTYGQKNKTLNFIELYQKKK